MFFLGIVLLFTTALNYVLVSVASLTQRAKAIGVHKDVYKRQALHLVGSGAYLGTVVGSASAVYSGRRVAGPALCAYSRSAGVPPLYRGEKGLEASVAVWAVCMRGIHQWIDVCGDVAISVCTEKGYGV